MSKTNKQVSAYILADHREDTGAIPYLSQMVASNNRINSKMAFKSGGGELIQQTVNNATIGDYSILIPSLKNPSKNILAVVFERKTWKDLAASIKDQRSVVQHKNMVALRDKKGCLLYYIIEGGLTYQDTTKICRIPFKNLHAKMRSMSLKGVHSFQTKDQQDTARLLINIARDISRLYRTVRISFEKQESNIPAVNPVMELNANLLTAFNKFYSQVPETDPILASLRNLVEMTSKSGSFNNQDLGYCSDNQNPENKNQNPENKNQNPENKDDKDQIIGAVDIPLELTTRPDRRNDDIIMNMWCALPSIYAKSAPGLIDNIDLYDLLSVPENGVM